MAWAKNSDLVVTYLFGTWVAGIATFADDDGTPLQCQATSFEEDRGTSSYDGSTLCDTQEINDPGRKNGTISFDARVPVGVAGRSFKGKEQLPVKLTIKENAAVVTPETVYGMVERVRLTAANDALQTEAVQIKLGIRLS